MAIPRLGEFERIARFFAPLAAPEALGLLDDVALIPGPPGAQYVLKTDAIVEGVHFLSDDPPEQVAQKLLRVNLSDLAAKGAEPVGYLLTTALPPTRDEATAMFVNWARKNPQYMSERPVDSLMRFAAATWPCRK